MRMATILVLCPPCLEPGISWPKNGLKHPGFQSPPPYLPDFPVWVLHLQAYWPWSTAPWPLLWSSCSFCSTMAPKLPCPVMWLHPTHPATGLRHQTSLSPTVAFKWHSCLPREAEGHPVCQVCNPVLLPPHTNYIQKMFQTTVITFLHFMLIYKLIIGPMEETTFRNSRITVKEFSLCLRPYRKPKESESEVAQSCLTLCNRMDCSLPGISIQGIFQAKVLDWVAISFSNRKLRMFV